MPHVRYAIPREDLEDLLIHQGKTLGEVAEIYNCSRDTISRKAKKYDLVVPARRDVRSPRDGTILPPCKFGKRISKCYLREAKAMLQGKDVSGRNRCVKLIGD